MGIFRNLKNKTKTMKNLFCILLAVTIFSVAGCGKKDDVKTDVKTDKQGTDVKTKDAEISDNKLPSDFPSDIPQFKDSKIIASVKTPQGTAVTFQMDGKPKDVSAFYKSEMSKSGYEADKNMEMMMTDKGGIMMYKKGGKEVSFTYGWDESSSKTSLVILIK